MSSKFVVLLISSFVFVPFAKAQTDSAKVAGILQSLLSICKNVDFGDPKTTELGTFYKAAPYIVYHGDDKERSWKVFANYSNAEDKKGVDEICARINGSVNQDSDYKIIKYFTEKESEGVWHVLMVRYKKDGAERRVEFAFLKIGSRFGLGDID